MKTLFISVLLIAVTAFGNAQEIELDEAEVRLETNKAKFVRTGDGFTYAVSEKSSGEFEKNPMAFMKSNLDINAMLEELASENFVSYQVTFRSDKGYLSAEFDKNGVLQRTSQKFRNIVLPAELRTELYNSNKGWSVISNNYIASGKGDLVNKEMYKIKLENANQKRTVKLDPRTLSSVSVASN
ncbi:hypothetical protein [Christiangramia portivictoriae]|uniref:hypothetical protein n=1 Tax=Christiangramia portivictoriae TaxID=326069 RepID=UPI00040BDF01|nr:hypothetical protein [Christiangramia portivictoriae]